MNKFLKIILVLALISMHFGYVHSQTDSNFWIKQNSKLPEGFKIAKIEVTNNSTVWLLAETEEGEISTIFSKTTDGGKNWYVKEMGLGDGYIPVDISAVNADIAFVIASHDDGGKIFKTTDGGDTWEEQNATFTTEVKIIKMFNESRGFCVADPDPAIPLANRRFTIFSTTNGGTTWSAVTGTPVVLDDELAVPRISSAIVSNGNAYAWFGTNKGAIYRLTSWSTFAFARPEVPASVSGMVIKSISFVTSTDVAVCFHKIEDDIVTESKVFRIGSNNSNNNFTAINYNDAKIAYVAAVPNKSGNYYAIVNEESDPEKSKTIFTANNGTAWTVLDTAINYTTMSIYDDNTGWVGSFITAEETGLGKLTVFPEFTSEAVTSVIEEDLYTYNVNVVDYNSSFADFDNEKEYPITLTLERPLSPTWLTLDTTHIKDGKAVLFGQAPALTSPTVSSQQITVRLRADNGIRFIEQEYTLTIRTKSKEPRFVTNQDNTPEMLTATTNKMYVYNIEAEDDDETQDLTLRIVKVAPSNSWRLDLYNVEKYTADGKAKIKAKFSGVCSETNNRNFDVTLSLSNRIFTVTQDFTIRYTYEAIGIEDFDYNDVNLYPNPTSNILNIVNCENSNYEIYDITGRIIRTGKINNDFETLDISDLKNGNFFIKVLNKDNVYTKTIVKM